MATTIRPSVQADIPAILELIVELQEHERALHDGLLPGREIAEAYFSYLAGHLRAAEGELLVAECEGRVVGFVACLIDRYEGPEEAADSAVYGLVSDLSVLPSWRGKGIAQSLLAAAEAHARVRGMTRLRVEVLSANRAARRAYGRYGFEPYVEIMEKRIT